MAEPYFRGNRSWNVVVRPDDDMCGPAPTPAFHATSILSVSLLIRPETKGLKFFPRSRFLLQFRSLVMFWRVPHRRAAEQPGAAFSPTPECARSAVCHIADDRGEPVSSRTPRPCWTHVFRPARNPHYDCNYHPCEYRPARQPIETAADRGGSPAIGIAGYYCFLPCCWSLSDSCSRRAGVNDRCRFPMLCCRLTYVRPNGLMRHRLNKPG